MNGKNAVNFLPNSILIKEIFAVKSAMKKLYGTKTTIFTTNAQPLTALLMFQFVKRYHKTANQISKSQKNQGQPDLLQSAVGTAQCDRKKHIKNFQLDSLQEDEFKYFIFKLYIT